MKRDRHIIQKYLDHDLSDKDMKRFEADLEVSSELQSDLNLYMEVDEALADTEVLSFRDQLTDLRKEERAKESTSKVAFKLNRPWQYVASAAVALFLAIGLASVLDKPLTSKDLIKKYYEPYEVALINRSADTDIDLILKQASNHYEDGDYATAVKYFSLVLEHDASQVATNLYTGISHFELEEYTDAKNSFTTVIEHQDNLYIETAEWYLGLCYLAMDQEALARREFHRIASGNSEYKKEAEKLLRKLRK